VIDATQAVSGISSLLFRRRYYIMPALTKKQTVRNG
jgi:hypothetical protein